MATATRSRSSSSATTARSRGSPIASSTHRVCRLANGLKSLGVKKGDRVIIYIPMSIEGVVAMQACARIGATHSVVFGGFSAKSLQERIIDAGATADHHRRRAGARRSRAADQGDRRRGDRRWAAARRSATSSSTGAPATRSASRPGATSGCTTWSRRRPTPASPNGSMPSIRCSSSTRRARPASRRACSTRPAATCCGRC